VRTQGAWYTPGYRLFMPFSGGATFVLLHGFSWMFYGFLATFVFAALPRLNEPRPAGPTGLLTVMGAFGLASQLLLVAALRHFNPDAAAGTPQAEGARRPGLVRAESLLGSLFLASSIIGFMLVDASDTGRLPALDATDARALGMVSMVRMRESTSPPTGAVSSYPGTSPNTAGAHAHLRPARARRRLPHPPRLRDVAAVPRRLDVRHCADVRVDAVRHRLPTCLDHPLRAARVQRRVAPPPHRGPTRLRDDGRLRAGA
jgi:hypothetical protein